MKFVHHDLGVTLELSYISGTDFLSDGDGDLYLIDEITGECLPVSGQTALEAILRRGKPDNGHCLACGSTCLKTNARAFKMNP